MIDRRVSRIPLCLLVLTTVVTSGWSQDFDDEPPEFLPGLIAEYRSGDVQFKKIDDAPNINLNRGRPDARLPENKFAARWSGLLQVKEDGQFQLSAYAQGKLQVRVDGRELLDDSAQENPRWLHAAPLELEFGRYVIEIQFESDESNGQLSLSWKGPGFGLEPLTSRYLQHASQASPNPTSMADPASTLDTFAVGRLLNRGLRCTACHRANELRYEADQALRAPALTHLRGNIRPSWMLEHLQMQAPEKPDFADRQMPYFALDRNSAMAISAALIDASQSTPKSNAVQEELTKLEKSRRRRDAPVRTAADPERGAEVFATVGCLACHQVGPLGDAAGSSSELQERLFGGGDLARLSAKRSADFIANWLEDPARVNPDHRMPTFQLTTYQRLDLAAYLEQLGSEESRHDLKAAGDIERGIGLIQQHRCGACHQLPQSLVSKETRFVPPLDAQSNWEAGCLGDAEPSKHIPGFGLSAVHREALKEYFSSRKHPRLDGSLRLAENNCLACHSRDQSKGISRLLADVAHDFPNTASKLAALAPPAITGVGDKLTDESLLAAIERRQEPLRDWLEIQMPRFPFGDGEARQLQQHFIAQDRIPLIEQNPAPIAATETKESALAAARLVTAQGFGCQSCHAIGPYETPQVDLKAKGTNLALLGSRIRESWFHRWVRNPSRIVPRMEMPAIQTPVSGVLGNNLDRQLDVLWDTLNQPDFVPPRPNPVRVVRSHNLPDLEEPAQVVTCVIESPAKNYLRPLVVGLQNRQNVLFDLENASLAGWWVGDTASQYTRGKTWYWEFGSPFLNALEQSQLAPTLQAIQWVSSENQVWRPKPQGQLAVHLDSITHTNTGVEWTGTLFLSHQDQVQTLTVQQTIRPDANRSVIVTRLEKPNFGQTGDSASGFVRLVSDLSFSAQQNLASYRDSNFQVRIEPTLATRLSVSQGTVHLESSSNLLTWTTTILPELPVDSFPKLEAALPPRQPKTLDCVPGYEAIELPLPRREMPISLSWDQAGQMYMGSLKGRVLKVHDEDGDHLEESYELISDEIPTPYGLHVNQDGSVDALAKYALLRLTPNQLDATWDSRVVADGWGYTADYHDWAVGLEIDSTGNYYMALPCQQDDRSEAAAHLRGHALRLVPNSDSQAPRAYRVESISAGLRFPMGLALSQAGDLFATDNQGNYNPFNELNHLRPGKRYGFINKLENRDGFSPLFESPAINLPHPWTRSVNGICWLTTPDRLRRQGVEQHFGDFEGHLIGCEMNGRSLVRMSLQQVGDTFQGAAYNFSLPGLEPDDTFEGPIVCKVAPTGDIYVGNLHDSGWGGGQNTGSIVRLRPEGSLPLGIAEVLANSRGFEIRLTQPIDPIRAADPAMFQLRSYRRVSTPAYGGDDQDERTERIARVQVLDQGNRLQLDLEKLREGCVYEINIGEIGPDGAKLFPAQAHYTMRRVPAE